MYESLPKQHTHTHIHTHTHTSTHAHTHAHTNTHTHTHTLIHITLAEELSFRFCITVIVHKEVVWFYFVANSVLFFLLECALLNAIHMKEWINTMGP